MVLCVSEQLRAQTYSVHCDIKQRYKHIKSSFCFNQSEDLNVSEYQNCWWIVSTVGSSRPQLNDPLWVSTSCFQSHLYSLCYTCSFEHSTRLKTWNQVNFHMCAHLTSFTNMAVYRAAPLCCVQVPVGLLAQRSLACWHSQLISTHEGEQTSPHSPKPSHETTRHTPSWSSHRHAGLWLCAAAHLWAHLRNQEVKLSSSAGRGWDDM